MNHSIAVIGATGVMGQPVTRQLIAAGFRVSVLSRQATKARAIFPDTTILEADAADKDSLVSALSGIDYLYLNLNIDPTVGPASWQSEREGLVNILEAAKMANIKRIGFISSMVMNYQGTNGFSWWVFDLKRQAVEMIKSAGISWLLFYPSTFMESFPYIYKHGKRILLAGESENPMWFIAADDYGRQVAKAFQATPAGQNREYVVQGPEPFTVDEAAKVFIENYPKAKLSISKAPLGLLKFLGRFSHKINYGAHIVEALNNYPEKFEAEATWKELGKPTTSLKEYAAAFGRG